MRVAGVTTVDAAATAFLPHGVALPKATGTGSETTSTGASVLRFTNGGAGTGRWITAVPTDAVDVHVYGLMVGGSSGAANEAKSVTMSYSMIAAGTVVPALTDVQADIDLSSIVANTPAWIDLGTIPSEDIDIDADRMAITILIEDSGATNYAHDLNLFALEFRAS